jgi:hypothetical protein
MRPASPLSTVRVNWVVHLPSASVTSAVRYAVQPSATLALMMVVCLLMSTRISLQLAPTNCPQSGGAIGSL